MTSTGAWSTFSIRRPRSACRRGGSPAMRAAGPAQRARACRRARRQRGQQRPHLLVRQCNPRSQLPLRRVDRSAQQGADPVRSGRRRCGRQLGLLEELRADPPARSACGQRVAPAVRPRAWLPSISGSAAAPTTRAEQAVRASIRQVHPQRHHHGSAAPSPPGATGHRGSRSCVRRIACFLPRAHNRVRTIARHHAPAAHRHLVRRAAPSVPGRQRSLSPPLLDLGRAVFQQMSMVGGDHHHAPCFRASRSRGSSSRGLRASSADATGRDRSGDRRPRCRPRRSRADEGPRSPRAPRGQVGRVGQIALVEQPGRCPARLCASSAACEANPDRSCAAAPSVSRPQSRLVRLTSVTVGSAATPTRAARGRSAPSRPSHGSRCARTVPERC